MPEFLDFRGKLQENFAKLISGQTQLFIVDVPKDTLWDTYLNSFPIDEVQSHNCNSCRQFIKPYGGIVAVVDGKIKSIWNMECDEPFQTVVNNLRDLVESAPIRDVFFSDTAKLGTEKNKQILESGEKIIWNHICLTLPKTFVTKNSVSFATQRAKKRDAIQVFKRTLTEMSDEAFEIVLELNAQGSIPRGAESKPIVLKMLELKRTFNELDENLKEGWIWKTGATLPEGVAKMRNHAIGTLLIDISKGLELDTAMRKYETVMCGANYKRPKALATAGMIKKAGEEVEELGLTPSLGRRFSLPDDVTINNVLFVDRAPKAVTSVFDALADTLPESPKKYDKMEEVPVEKFLKDILPTAKAVEIMMESRHTGNLVSLISPTVADCQPLFKWDNPFSWTYNNDMADSMKEAVKKAGGKVDGELRFSIQWNEKGDNSIDFDAHMYTPANRLISYSNSYDSATQGRLDVDIVRPGKKLAVENITFPKGKKLTPGVYKCLVHCFSGRTSNGGFSAELEHNGTIHSFSRSANLEGKKKYEVIEFRITESNDLEIIKSMDSSSSVNSKEVWKLPTFKFHKVKMLMHSPNFWDGKEIGNKHYFFMLENCLNPEPARGFYNEFLRTDLEVHRKTFEMLGAKLKAPYSDSQLSGLGFPCTQKNSVICRVEGSFKRVIKIIF